MAHKNKQFTPKFKLPKLLQSESISLRGVPRSWEKPAELQSPKSLVELAADVLDQKPLPECMFWNNERVLEWLENTVGFPEYKETFGINCVNGRQLILLGPDHLVKMNIKNWDHIKVTMKRKYERNMEQLDNLSAGEVMMIHLLSKGIFLKRIMTCIRQQYGVPRPKFERDLTKPAINRTEYHWEMLYYRYIARMTPQNAILRSEYWRMTKMMNTKPEEMCHWYTMSTEQRVQDKVFVARVSKKRGKERMYVPMFRENHYTFTTIMVYYLDSDPLTW